MERNPSTAPQPKYLSEYSEPSFWIDSIDLEIDLYDDFVEVNSVLKGRRNLEQDNCKKPLRLNGQNQQLMHIELDGLALDRESYWVDGEILEIGDVGEIFTLAIRSYNWPSKNTALEGLYISNGMYCTQCEAEGFRCITFFPDRPDIMATYTTTIKADSFKFPKLLSNGNMVSSGSLPDGRHFVQWYDPFPKPSYLFAMVAGDLACVEDSFRTLSGRNVTLQIYVQHGEEGRCGHAMSSLKRAMAWDEERYGLEYDLDILMLVAVDHFNMGAMENKGLNIFNSRFVLVDFETATDEDFRQVESIIAHEYFHNWTGNRVTCRDWFQLSLKEGLTVFRDQEFSADIYSRPVQRINDVKTLRNVQFEEDSGPTAHAVRPETYIEINNFYTATVYEKGAEIVRLIHTLVGDKNFNKGLNLYIKRHDGKAVTCEDFVDAMQTASGVELSKIMLWYSQVGTPEIDFEMEYKPKLKEVTLSIRQNIPDAFPDNVDEPMIVPIKVGLLNRRGAEIPLRLRGDGSADVSTTKLLVLREFKQSFVFNNISDEPIISILRGFTAPVKLSTNYKTEDLALLMKYDTDSFGRWDAFQRYGVQLMLGLVREAKPEWPLELDPLFLDAMATTLLDQTLSPTFKAEILRLPSEAELAQQMLVIDVENIYLVRKFISSKIGESLYTTFDFHYKNMLAAKAMDELTNDAMGLRALGNSALFYMVASGRKEALQLALAQVREGKSMSMVIAALRALNDIDCNERGDALTDFYERWQNHPLELDKWFVLKATSSLPETLAELEKLIFHPKFDLTSPNNVRALVGSFGFNNQVRFHRIDGKGYRFLSSRVLELDKINPQVAARLLIPLTRWKRHEKRRSELMGKELKRIMYSDSISKDVFEIVKKGLVCSYQVE